MARGYNTLGDVIKKTVDGKDLNDLWTEFQMAVALRNEQRQTIQGLFTFDTTLAADEVLQGFVGDDFELASEYGEPRSLRVPSDTLKMGFGLKFYDTATRYTWKFLAEASAAQVESAHDAALDADSRLVWRLIMRGLLTKTTIATRPVNENGVAIYPLYDGEADSTPPDYAGQSFAPGHQHYLTTESASIDGGDLKDLIKHLTHHGYGVSSGSTIVVLCHPNQGESIRGFRVTGGAPFDFIASASAPAFLTNLQVVGKTPPEDFNGLKVIGSYGDALIVEDYYVPAGYVIALATAGANSPANALGFREHARTELRGLQQIPGSEGPYPLSASTYVRGAGVGVRNRGAAAVMQVTVSSDYTSPTIS